MALPTIPPGLLRTVSLFMAVGPLAGTVVVWTVLGVIVGVTAVIEPGGLTDLFGGLGGLPPLLFLSLIAGYLLGVVPAAVTGVVCHLAVGRAGLIVWLPVATAAGFAVTACVALLATLTLTQAIYGGVVSAVAAVVCAWLVRRSRV